MRTIEYQGSERSKMIDQLADLDARGIASTNSENS